MKNQEKNEETNFGIYDTAPRKMTKSEKKKKKAGALANLNPDLAFEVDDPMSNLKKAARNMRFQSDQVCAISRKICNRKHISKL